MLTLVGKVRPGVVAEVSQVLFKGGGNLGEASMGRLVGKRNALKKRTDF